MFVQFVSHAFISGSRSNNIVITTQRGRTNEEINVRDGCAGSCNCMTKRRRQWWMEHKKNHQRTIDHTNKALDVSMRNFAAMCKWCR